MVTRVIKRSGESMEFKPEKIENAIYLASTKSLNGACRELARRVVGSVVDYVNKNFEETVSVEKLQDIVENFLMDSDRKDVAKEYILYRGARAMKRNVVSKEVKSSRLLSEKFLSKYKHTPSPMGALGSFVYYRTYSRFMDEVGRREEWWETVARAVEYNMSLVPGGDKAEAEELFDNIFFLRQFLSGRTFWVGGTDVAKKFPTANYNCAFTVIDKMESFSEAFYLLMVGSGVGFRVLKADADKLPRVRTNIEIIHEQFIPEEKHKRHETTSISFNETGEISKIKVGDSKEGWVSALEFLIQLTYAHKYKNVKTVLVDYNSVRPRGERLKTFGGTASGYNALQTMFRKIDGVIKKAGARAMSNKVKLEPIDCMDIMNIMGACVVVGGVRRTAELGLIDAGDNKCITAKNEIYYQDEEGKWVANSDILHRQMSNNSIFYESKPEREQLHWHLQQIRFSGEPGFVNAEAARKRRSDFQGVNPCAEILLADKGLCNLTTNNVMAFVEEKDGAQVFNRERWLKAIGLSVRAGYRMSAVYLELPEWDNNQQRDRLLGVSLTGWQDMVNATGMEADEQAALLKATRKHAAKAAEGYAAETGGNIPLLVTTVKPEGTLSQLPTVSSGLHFSHSPYYLRRVRISKNDVLANVCRDLGYPVEEDVNNPSNLVISFPVKSPKGRTKYDVSALEQLEVYKMFMNTFVEHNASITVHVREDEWNDVEKWLWENWDDVVAISFLSLDDHFYAQAPYEKITKKEYLKRAEVLKPMVPSLIARYETTETEIDIGDAGCEGGICVKR